MRKIILDCDTGTDDAMAIIMAALSKDIDLSAITCVHGNLPLKRGMNEMMRMGDIAPKKSIALRKRMTARRLPSTLPTAILSIARP